MNKVYYTIQFIGIHSIHKQFITITLEININWVYYIILLHI